ncbi:MAG: hypothetical protein P0Y50_08860 [Candidatus Brevundimonas colombiensis]|uniref:Uncharacterized protein n=1 Tax=Candidatus Brevundimonas colombiensis TaxID=3121376 RepID=A0AAJ6BJT6_9CAUL|nr:hypothetical protein [Brevundimonas sp.]WEK38662.1 MAG: hypothetical protein P0Y50_08860 [Brevundimonas sp.]
MAGGLFEWEAVRRAQAAVADAHARQAAAQRRALFAPHGVKRQREADLKAAVAAALNAELALSAACREAEA